MAETIVLCELSIDSTGVVTGVAAVDKALAQGAKRTQEFADTAKRSAPQIDLLSDRMFNLRSAAAAVLGSFTAAGLIYGLKSLAGEAVSANTAFKPMADSWERFGNSLKVSLAYMPGVTGALNALGGAAEKPESAITRMFNVLANLAPVATVAFSNLGSALDAAVPGTGTGGAGAGAPIWERIGFLDVPAKNVKKAVEETHEPLRKAVRLTGDWNQEMELLGQHLREAFGEMSGGRDPEGTNLGFDRPGGLGSGVAGMDGDPLFTESDIPGQMDEVSESVLRATEAYEAFGIVAPAAYAAVNAAVAAGVISQATAMRLTMAMEAAHAILLGKIQVALAVAEAAAGHYGRAALHGVAAGLFFSAAAFYSRGAIAGPGAESGGGGGGVGAAASPTRAPIYNTTYVIEGSMINGDTFIRWLKDQERRSGER